MKQTEESRDLLEASLCNPTVEQMLIGALFATPDPEVFSRVSGLVSTASFAIEKHRLVFSAMTEVFEAGTQISYGTVLMALEKHKHLRRVDGLIDLAQNSARIVDIGPLCEELAELERLRKIIAAADAIRLRALSRDRSDLIVSEADGLLQGAQSGNTARQGALRPSQIIQRAGGFIPNLNGGAIAIPTPWPRLNESTNGLRQGKLWIVGALPGTGKTSFAAQITAHAVMSGYRVKVFSYEELSDDLLMNMACTRSRVDSQALLANQLTREEMHRYMGAMTMFAEEYDDFLEIADDECGTVPSIGASLRRGVAEGRPADLVIVDFLQLLTGVGDFDARNQEVRQIAYGLKKNIAKQFRVPVLALAQLNTRKSSSGHSMGAPNDNVMPKREAAPTLGDFAESAAIEQAADLAFIMRLHDVEQQFLPTQLIDLFLLKQRGGKRGMIPFKFHSVYRDFEEVQRPAEYGRVA